MLERDTALDTLYGEDGDDTIKAVNLPAYSADIVNCGPGSDDGATVDPLDTEDPLGTAEDRCENTLTISERTGERVSGYFDKLGNSTHVEFESYVDNEEGGFLPESDPNSRPYDRATTSVITLDDDTLPGDEPRIRIKLTVNPGTKNIRQRVTTPEGSQKKLSDQDRRAIEEAGDLLQTFLDRKNRGDCDMKNQETLVLRHFSLLSQTTNSDELKDLDRTYEYPERGCNNNGSTTRVSAKGASGGSPTSVFLKRVSGKGRCATATVSEEPGSSELAMLASADTQYIPLQSGSGENVDNGTTLLPCSGAPVYVGYDLADGSFIDYPTESGLSGDTGFGACGTSFLQFGYTQDCLDHDACVYDLMTLYGADYVSRGPGDPNCGDEFGDALDDTINGIGLTPDAESGLCDPSLSRSSGPPEPSSPGPMAGGDWTSSVKA